MELNFQVNQQTIKRINKSLPANKSQKSLQLSFEFETEDWSDLSKFALFTVDGLNYRVGLIEDKALVPNACLQADRFSFSVYGIDNQELRITTNRVIVYLTESGFTEDVENDIDDTDPSIVEQIYLDMNTSISNLKSYTDDELALKVNIDDYNRQIEQLEDYIDLKVDISDYEAKVGELEDNIDLKVNIDDYETKVEELENNIDLKVDISDYDVQIEEIENDIDLKEVTITKQSVADTGYFSTYVISQGGTALSPKINIPKDYLLKSASLLQCTVKDVPIDGLNVGDWYFDWVLNTTDSSEEETHLYLNANVLTDVYEGDNETIIISDNVISVKPNVFAFKVHTHSKSDITDFNHTHTESDITDLQDYALISDLPTKTSELENDVPFLTEHQSLSDYYTKEEVEEIINNIENKFIVTANKQCVQIGETIDIASKIKKDGFPVTGTIVHFYEVLEPSIQLSSSESIIQLDDNTDLYATVRDEDGSKAKDMKVYFFKEEEEELIEEDIETDDDTELINENDDMNLNNDMED